MARVMAAGLCNWYDILGPPHACKAPCRCPVGRGHKHAHVTLNKHQNINNNVSGMRPGYHNGPCMVPVPRHIFCLGAILDPAPRHKSSRGVILVPIPRHKSYPDRSRMCSVDKSQCCSFERSLQLNAATAAAACATGRCNSCSCAHNRTLRMVLLRAGRCSLCCCQGGHL